VIFCCIVSQVCPGKLWVSISNLATSRTFSTSFFSSLPVKPCYVSTYNCIYIYIQLCVYIYIYIYIYIYNCIYIRNV